MNVKLISIIKPVKDLSVQEFISYVARISKSKETQLEHREIAEAYKKILIEVLPDVSKALGWT